MTIARARLARKGLSLMEVVIAVAIFLMSIVALGSLINSAQERAIQAAHRSQAARLCQSKLNEVIAGVLPLESQGETTFDEDPDFTWAVEAEPGTITNLYNVRVVVRRALQTGGTIECSISQMILDPAVIGSTQDAANIAGTDQAEAGTEDSTMTETQTNPMGGSP
jgi:Tfp pilus assembly protein PilV